jgi:hypothetical protein
MIRIRKRRRKIPKRMRRRMLRKTIKRNLLKRMIRKNLQRRKNLKMELTRVANSWNYVMSLAPAKK